MSNSSRVILIVGGSMDYGRPYKSLAASLGLSFTNDDSLLDREPTRVALAVFTGGEDVDPSLYGKTTHQRTYSNLKRDKFEQGVFHKLRAHGIPLAGICRGSQFLCVMAGGELVQDITGHGGVRHPLHIKQKDGSTRSVMVNSSHHQMQNPFGLVEGEDYQLIGWMEEPLSRHYAFDEETTVPAAGLGYAGVRLEPDIVFYPKIKALCAQYHPEWLSTSEEGFTVYEELVEQYLLPLIADDKNRTYAA